MTLEQFEKEAGGIRQILEGRHEAREEVLKQSRLLIQTCSKCIKHVHRRQMEDARRLLGDAQALSKKMREAAVNHPEVLFAGYIQDSEKEMVEAASLIALVNKEDLPTLQDLGVGATSWLHGMGEAASEARRYVLDDMRQGRLVEASEMLKMMEAIYDELTTFDFPDGLTGGLRRTCDALRAVIERTRSDLTLTIIQSELLNELRAKK